MPDTTDRDTARTQALIEEACKKSAMLWFRPLGSESGAPPAQPAWHVWTDGAVHVVTGGIEQQVPCLTQSTDDARVLVTVRSKDTGGRLVTWTGRVRRLLPDDDAWTPVVTELHAKRLNPPDGEGQPQRWARESAVYRIEVTGGLVESPGHSSSDSHAAAPPASPATTRGRLPFIVGRRARRRR